MHITRLSPCPSDCFSQSRLRWILINIYHCFELNIIGFVVVFCHLIRCFILRVKYAGISRGKMIAKSKVTVLVNARLSSIAADQSV